MWAQVRRIAGPLVGRRARLRWLHLILGGALLTPYHLVMLVVVGLFAPRLLQPPGVAGQLLAFAAALPLAALTGVVPVARVLSVAAARTLLGVPVSESTGGHRGRTAAWYVLHLALGGPVSGMTLAVPPAVVALCAAPFVPGWRPTGGSADWVFDLGARAPAAGLGLLAGLVCVAAAAGAVLVRLAPVLLGPSPADRLAAAERRAADLARRNELARELHDSIGHTLSVVTIQAGAAARVMGTDPAFVTGALTAIDESARRALADLDHVLGLLREDPPPATAPATTAPPDTAPPDTAPPDTAVRPDTAPSASPATGAAPAAAPAPTLADLDRLVEQVRLAGAEVTPTVTGDLAGLPSAVSREAYRIVQEGLTNALRHAGAVPVTLRVDIGPDQLAVEMTNPLGSARPPGLPNGGRGLRGIAERAGVLRGEATAGREGDWWRLAVRLPLRPVS